MAEGLFCGDGNKGGNIGIWYRGACQKPIEMAKSFRCTGCGGWFHFDCIFDHFEQERGHSIAHNALKAIIDNIDLLSKEEIVETAKAGLAREYPKGAFTRFLENLHNKQAPNSTKKAIFFHPIENETDAKGSHAKAGKSKN